MNTSEMVENDSRLEYKQAEQMFAQLTGYQNKEIFREHVSLHYGENFTSMDSHKPVFSWADLCQDTSYPLASISTSHIHQQ